MIIKIIKYLLFVFSVFIPLVKGRYVFSSNSEYISDDIFWFIKHLSSNENLDLIWLGSIDIQSVWVKKVKKNCLKAWVYSLTAEKVFFTHGLNDLNNVCNLKSARVNLWHGCPVKKIGEDSSIFSSRRGLIRRHWKPERFLWTEFFVGTLEWEEIFRRGYGLTKSQINSDGLPRSSYLKAMAESKYNLTSSNYIAFAPTYRNGITDYSAYDLILKNEVIQTTLRNHNMILLVKLHAIDDYTYETNDVIIDAQDTSIYDLLLKSKAVITDYSSLIFDFSILNKPLILFMPDLEEFSTKIGGFYFDFPEGRDFDWVARCYYVAEVVAALDEISIGNVSCASEQFVNKFNNFNATEYLIKGG